MARKITAHRGAHGEERTVVRESGRFAGSAGAPAAPGVELVTTAPRKSIDQFRHALQVLDAELRAMDLPESVKVRATGGFAMLAHGLREDGYTVDIDTLTDDYEREVRDAVNRVARDLHLEQDWINNQAAGLGAEQTLAMLDAKFLPLDFGLDRIDLQVADVPTLTRAKAFAVNDDAISGRTRDWDDLLELLDHQGIDDYDGFARAYPEVREWEYPEVHRSLRSWFETGDRGEPEPGEADFDFDDLDWLDEELAA